MFFLFIDKQDLCKSAAEIPYNLYSSYAWLDPTSHQSFNTKYNGRT